MRWRLVPMTGPDLPFAFSAPKASYSYVASLSCSPLWKAANTFDMVSCGIYDAHRAILDAAKGRETAFFIARALRVTRRGFGLYPCDSHTDWKPSKQGSSNPSSSSLKDGRDPAPDIGPGSRN